MTTDFRRPFTPIARLLGSVLLMLLLGGCDEKPSQLERIQERGELIVATRYGETTWQRGADGPEGIEYDLVTAFAEHLGVTPRFVFPDRFTDTLGLVESGTVDMAAAGITVTERRKRRVRFGPAYQHVVSQVVYRRGERRPRRIADLAEGDLEIIAGSSHETLLRDRRRREFPKLEYTANDEVSIDQLLQWVAIGFIDYTIADSNQLELTRRRFPELRAAFDLSGKRELAWALPRGQDASLLDAVRAFFQIIEADGELNALIDRYYGHTEKFTYVEIRDFRRAIDDRLPLYIDAFKQASRDTGFDWRLLAAVGYQESHWRADAVSPTGVRGLMMLTTAAAKRVGVEDREDPLQSIAGGARYLGVVRKKIPKRIPEPDRTWLALAGYNVGFGHLEDARILAQRAGANPDRWADVKRYLPLLAKHKWYSQTRHGKARGWEPVDYVDAVRGHMDMLYDHYPDTLPIKFVLPLTRIPPAL
ncbi:MAG: membrane-bound lytic murein transglycosylase MltF [Gammaproteobacteria bacterium]|nr:membrane-bound lytic murein transglycosylase MltF [Gammaproteobacteria bacterium]